MTTHHTLTEPSPQMHPRKGREGKGNRKGTLGRRPHPSLRSVTRGRDQRTRRTTLDPDAWMAADAAIGGLR